MVSVLVDSVSTFVQEIVKDYIYVDIKVLKYTNIAHSSVKKK